jgi:hypothetical protein
MVIKGKKNEWHSIIDNMSFDIYNELFRRKIILRKITINGLN